MCIGLPDVPKHAETLDIWFHDGGNGHRGNDAGEGHQGQLGRHGHAAEALQLGIRQDGSVAGHAHLEQHHGLVEVQRGRRPTSGGF